MEIYISRALKALLWKNFKRSIKQWPLLLLQITIPIVYFIILSFGISSFYGDLNKSINSTPSTSYKRIMDMKTIKSFVPPREQMELWHIPTSNSHRKIINYVARELELDDDIDVMDFRSRQLLFNELYTYQKAKHIYIVIIEPKIETRLSYNISLHKDYLEWKTRELYRTDYYETNHGYNPYVHEGIIALQILINKAYIELFHKDSGISNTTIQLQEILNEKNDSDQRVEHLFFTILPLSIIFTFGFPVFFNLQKEMVREQDAGMNNLMQISGIPIRFILLAWFLKKTAIALFSIVPIVLLQMLGILPLIYCPCWIFGMFLIAYTITVIVTYLFFASENSTVGFMIGLGMWFISYSLPFIMDGYMTFPLKIILSILFSNVALHYGCEVLTKHEIAEIPLDFFGTTTMQYDLSMGLVLFLLLLNIMVTCFCLFLAIIFRESEVWHIFVDKIASLFRTRKDNDNVSELLLSSLSFKNTQMPILTMRNVMKKHGIHKVLEISKLDLFKGDILAVLGTSGAGKTTLVSIITGISKEYSGKIAFGEFGEVRPVMGYCPQQNIVYEDLTIWENLVFFAKLRTSRVNESVERVLKELDLYERRNDAAGSLSTGQRRKLSLGMALVGDPTILILDEPTGGVVMDTNNNIIGDLLGKRHEQTVIITTHDPEEAELVTDKILILDNGRILNEESTTFKELREGDGYFISLVVSDSCHTNILERHLKDNCPNLKILQRVGKKIAFHLNGGKEECYTYIEKLENMKNNCNIETISVNVDIMDNIFVKKISEQNDTQIEEQNRDFSSQIRNNVLPDLMNLYKDLDYGYKRRILLNKLFFLWTNYYWHLPGFLIMALMFSITMLTSSEGRYYYRYDEPSLNLDLNIYKSTEVSFPILNQSKVDVLKQDWNNINIVPDINDLEKKITNGTLRLREINIAAVDYVSDLYLNIIYSSSALHSAPVSVNFAMNVILRLKKDNFSLIRTNIVPLNQSHSNYILKKNKHEKITWVWAIFLPLGILASLVDYIAYPKIERTTHFLRLQASSFSRLIFYWYLNWAIDIIYRGFLQLGIIFLYILLINFVFFKDPLLQSEEIQIVYIVLLIYNMIQLPFCYLFGSLAGKMNRDYENFILFGIVFGILPVLLLLIKSQWIPFIEAMHYIIPVPQLALCYHLHTFGYIFTENYNWNNMNPLEKKYLCRNETANPCCRADSAECAAHRSYFLNGRFLMGSHLLYSVIQCMLLSGILLISYSYGSSYRYKAVKSAKKCIPKSITISKNDSVLPYIPNQFMLEIKHLLFYALHRKISCKFSFLPNALYGIQGSTGSGKSVFLTILTKECSSFTGDIQLNNQRKTIKIWDKEYNRKIGFFPGRIKLDYFLTSRNLLILAGLSRGYNLQKSSDAANILLETFGLKKYANRKCKLLSGGNKKMLQICAAFVGFPDFVIIDDVAKSLDLSRRKALWDFYLAFKECTKKTVIMGMGRKEKYTDLCDEFLDLDDEEHSAPSGRSYCYKITFRMKIIRKEARDDFKFQLEACRDIIKSSFGQTLPNGDNNSRFLNIKIDSSEVQLLGLVIKADNLKFNHSAYIEDYSIAEILASD